MKMSSIIGFQATGSRRSASFHYAPNISCRYISTFVLYFIVLFVSIVDCSKWEQSKIWPAITKIELYDTGYHDMLLRTFHSKDWNFHYKNNTIFDNNNNEDLHEILMQSELRFQKNLDIGVPSDSCHYPVNPHNAILTPIQGIRIDIAEIDVTLKHGVDESYQIHVPYPIDIESSFIEVKAQTVYGVLHAIETIQQLLLYGWTNPTNIDHVNDDDVYILLDSPLYIEDAPTYPYRGLMIDTARHFLPLDLIVGNLDVMASNKLNVLHWHLTDSQSWPYKSKKFPEISEKGSYCYDCIYDSNDIKLVIKEAALRGIRVVVEIDLPGHSQAIANSHPELFTQCNNNGPSEPLDATEPKVYEFVHAVYAEIAEIFPETFIHIGGDEVPLDCWKRSEKVQNWMKAHNITSEVQLLDIFEQDLTSNVINKLHKRPIAWQELFDSGVDLPKSVIVDIWKEGIRNETTFNATEAGYDVVISSCWYLDHLNDDWWKYYGCDPRGVANATEEQLEHVIGGHASMWGERVDFTNFFQRVWPRASSMAEVLWTGSPSNHSNLSSRMVQDRLTSFRCFMLCRVDIPAAPIKPGYCYCENDSNAELDHIATSWTG